ncbi:TPA: hypothetical protein ACRR3T_004770 [Enterobacter asburiae]
MLAYITVGTNDFKRSVNFYDVVFNVLGYSRLPAWTESWAMWGDENNPGEGFSFCILKTMPMLTLMSMCRIMMYF